MQRYSTINDVEAWKNDSGKWVKYTDAAARMQELKKSLQDQITEDEWRIKERDARIQELEAALAASQAECERLREANRWISTGDNLPEGGWKLVVTSAKQFEMMFFDGWNWSKDIGGSYESVDFWRELPELPKEVE